MKESDFAHLYKLEPGDKWCWIGDEIVVANPEKIPFTINLKTGKILNMTLDREITKEFYCERSWIHYGYYMKPSSGTISFADSIPTEEGYYWFKQNDEWEVVKVQRLGVSNSTRFYVWSAGWEVPLDYDEPVVNFEWGAKLTPP